MKSPSSSLTVALVLSVGLHAAVLSLGAPSASRSSSTQARGSPSPRSLDATLVAPVVKNTLDDPAQEPQAAPAAKSDVTPPGGQVKQAPAKRAPAMRLAGKPLQQAQKALAEHLFYPPEAVERQLEGEVVLLLVLSESGDILRAEVASSSGHAVLDRAALRAARSIGRLKGLAGRREVLFPVSFQLT